MANSVDKNNKILETAAELWLNLILAQLQYQKIDQQNQKRSTHKNT